MGEQIVGNACPECGFLESMCGCEQERSLMSEIQRYENRSHLYDSIYSGMFPSSTGKWVSFSDYKPIAKRVQELEEALRELQEAASLSLRVGYGSDDCGDHCMNNCHWCSLRDAECAAVEALRK